MDNDELFLITTLKRDLAKLIQDTNEYPICISDESDKGFFKIGDINYKNNSHSHILFKETVDVMNTEQPNNKFELCYSLSNNANNNHDAELTFFYKTREPISESVVPEPVQKKKKNFFRPFRH